MADPNSNKRYGLRKMGRLTGLDKDEIDILLPATIDEMKAEDENQALNLNKLVEVDVIDDDIAHLEIHNKVADFSAKYAHIQAHKRSMLLKKVMAMQNAQQQGQGQNPGQTPGGAPPNPDVQKELVAPTLQKNNATV